CNHRCVKKAWTGQLCDAPTAGEPCSESSGTIWPFSGCDISAGSCCNGKCSATPCPPGGEGTPCNKPNGTIWPASTCDISAGLCCNGKCSSVSCTATPQRGKCTLDSDCAGWSALGDIACCANQCVTKDFSEMSQVLA